MNPTSPPQPPTRRRRAAWIVALILAPALGCGDEATRMAGTLDFPDRSAKPVDAKQAAADFKAKARDKSRPATPSEAR